MERFRSFIKAAFSYPRLLLKTHPVTAVSIIATSVLYAVYTFIEFGLGYEWTKTRRTELDVFSHICLTVLFFAILLFVDFCFHMFPAGMQGEAMGFVVLTVSCVIAYFFILWISYKVSKPRPPKTKPQSVPVEPTTVEAEPESATTAPAEQKIQPEQKKSPEAKA